MPSMRGAGLSKSLTSHPTQNRSSRRRSFQPISQLGTEETTLSAKKLCFRDGDSVRSTIILQTVLWMNEWMNEWNHLFPQYTAQSQTKHNRSRQKVVPRSNAFILRLAYLLLLTVGQVCYSTVAQKFYPEATLASCYVFIARAPYRPKPIYYFVTWRILK